MSPGESEGTPLISAGTVRETRKREFEEKQKFFELKKRKRQLQLQFENQVDALTLESESLRYQEEDLSHCQRHCALKRQKLAETEKAVAQMEQRINAERENLVELQKTFDAQHQMLESTAREFRAETEAFGSLERDVVSKRQKLAADEEELALTKKKFDECDGLLSVHGNHSESGSSKEPQNHSLSSFDAESVQENLNCLPRTPSSSHIRPISSGAKQRTVDENHAFTIDGHGYFLGSPKGELYSALLREIRAKRKDQLDNSIDPVLSENEANVRSARVIEDHRQAILDKAKKLNKPIEDTDRIKYKASHVPADPRTAIPDKMRKSARLKSFNELNLVRRLDQYVGDVNWFGEERPLAALLAYMTGDVREPCTNCKKAADSGNQYWTQFLMCVTSDKLISGECCHCHFRTAEPPCSHRTGDSTSPTKRSSSSTPYQVTGEVAQEPQCTPKEVKKEETTLINGFLFERKAKVDARSRIRRASAQTLIPDDKEEAEQSDSMSLMPG